MNKKEKEKKYTGIAIVLLIILAISIFFTTYKIIKSRNDKEISRVEQNENDKNFEIDDPKIEKKDIVLKIFTNDIEYMTKWSFNNFLDYLVEITPLDIETDYKITINETELLKEQDYVFDMVGDVKVIISNNSDSKEIVLKVVDTIKPVISGVKDKTITVGDKIDLLSGISAKDEIEGNIVVKTDSKVDTKKVGTYTVLVYAIDKNGNRVEASYKVTVKAKNTSKPSTGSSESSSGSGNSGSSGSTTPTGCTFTNTLKKRGYKKADPEDVCKKDAEASAIAKKIADEILAKGYTKDIDKVQAAASVVQSYYSKGVHVEEGYDYRTAYGVFIKGEASCAGCTRALLLVLEYMGFKNMTHANENGFTHQWVILEMDGQKGFADGQVAMVGYGCHPVDEDPSCSQ